MITVITTCRGRTVAHLEALLGCFEKHGHLDRVCIASDGPAPALRTRAQVVESAAPAGQAQNYWRALELGSAAAQTAGLDRFLVLEDDIELCANAVPYIARATRWRDLDFVTWFDGHALPAAAPNGLYRAPTDRFAFLQAISWPLATATRLLTSPLRGRWTERHRGDLLVRSILSRGVYGVHVPNLAEHVGSVSLCSPTLTLEGTRSARNYPGTTFDALQLPDFGL